MGPTPANPKLVAEVVMVSKEATPDTAPPVVTFNPPLEVNANVPVPLPIAVLAVPDVLILAAPTTVNPPFAVRSPVEVKVPAPVRLAPAAVKAVVPPGARRMLPVVAEPNVKVCLAVVAMVPSAVR